MPEFSLVVARGQQQLLQLLTENPNAQIVAGATDFIPLTGAGKWKPHTAIDISQVQELRGSQVAGGWLCLGPLTTHAEATSSPLIQEHAKALAEACASVADPLIRSRATLGGNLCTASPAADSVPALLSLGAELRLNRLDHERRIPLESFLVGPGQTALQAGETLTGIYIPILPPNSGSAFIKLGRRQAMAISVANAAVFAQIRDQKISALRLALGSVAPTVVRSRSFETALIGLPVVSQQLQDQRFLGLLINQDISPIDDVRASAMYRRQVAGAIAQSALELALKRAQDI